MLKYNIIKDTIPSIRSDFNEKIGSVPLPPIYNPQDLKAALVTYGLIYMRYPPGGSSSANYHAVLLVGIGDPKADCKDPNLLILDPAIFAAESGVNSNANMPFSQFKKLFYSQAYSELYVLGVSKSSQQPLQSEDMPAVDNQPLSSGDPSENSGEERPWFWYFVCSITGEEHHRRGRIKRVSRFV